MKKKTNFYADLKYGQEAEAKFLERFPFLEAIDGRMGDFKIKGTKIKIEYKSDRYSHEKYPNFIFERYSYDEKDGGPFQALKHKCRFFVYHFATEDIIYVFNTRQLVSRINRVAKKLQSKLYEHKNPHHTTRYYKLDRSLFTDILLGINEMEKLCKK